MVQSLFFEIINNMNKILIYDRSGGYSRALKIAFNKKYDLTLVKNIDKLESIDLLKFNTAFLFVQSPHDFYSFSIIDKKISPIIVASNEKINNLKSKKKYIELDLGVVKKIWINTLKNKLEEIFSEKTN